MSEAIPLPVDPGGAGISRSRFLMALSICPSKEVFERLYKSNGPLGRSTPAAVLQAYPMFTDHDVKVLALHWGLHQTRTERDAILVNGYRPVAPKPAMADESFEALAQRLSVRVAEILLDKWLK